MTPHNHSAKSGEASSQDAEGWKLCQKCERRRNMHPQESIQFCSCASNIDSMVSLSTNLTTGTTVLHIIPTQTDFLAEYFADSSEFLTG